LTRLMLPHAETASIVCSICLPTATPSISERYLWQKCPPS
jgi:hypothetical protein